MLRPGGRLGLVWNRRDERTAWLAEFGEIMKGGFSHDFQMAVVGPPFGALERLDTEWSYELTTEQLEDLATSRSYVIGMSPAQREAVLKRVRELAARELARTGATKLSMPYVTQSLRARVQEA